MARKPKKPALKDDEPIQPKKWGYARVSTSDQDMRMQRDALIAIGVDPRDIFEETASGASVEKRFEFQAMMKEVHRGDTVYVWKLDRMARNVIDLHNTAKVIDERGARLVVLTMPGMDTATPTGRLLFTLLAAVAEFERELTRERTLAGLKAARERGRIGGRKSNLTLEMLQGALDETRSIRGAAKKLGLSLQGYKRALLRERAKAGIVGELE